jgi:selenoprotein W-related protein
MSPVLGLRAGWMAQELLATLAEEIGSVVLTPDTSGGRFEIHVKKQRIWSRKEDGRFPEMKEIKQLVRDRIAPRRSWPLRSPLVFKERRVPRPFPRRAPIAAQVPYSIQGRMSNR